MVESARTTLDELRDAIEDALVAGVVTRNEILDMVATTNTPGAKNGHAFAEPNSGADELPIYTELPEGMIDLPSASKKYGISIRTLQSWVHRGKLPRRGKLRARSPGGGYIVTEEAQILYCRDNPRKPWHNKCANS